MDVDNIRS